MIAVFVSLTEVVLISEKYEFTGGSIHKCIYFYIKMITSAHFFPRGRLRDEPKNGCDGDYGGGDSQINWVGECG